MRISFALAALSISTVLLPAAQIAHGESGKVLSTKLAAGVLSTESGSGSDETEGPVASLTLEALKMMQPPGSQTKTIQSGALQSASMQTVINDPAGILGRPQIAIAADSTDGETIPRTCGTAFLGNASASFQAFRINSFGGASQKTIPTSVNSAGDLVGWYVLPGSNPPASRAFRARISRTGQLQSTTTLPNHGLYSTFAFGISDDGQVAVGSGCQDFSGTSGGTNYCSTLTTAIACTGNPPQCFRPRALRWNNGSTQPLLIPKPEVLPQSDPTVVPDWCTGSTDTLCNPMASEAADANSDACSVVGNYAHRATDGRPYVQRAFRWDATVCATDLTQRSVGTSRILEQDFGQPFCTNPANPATCIEKASALGISADGGTVSGTYIAGQAGIPNSSQPFRAFKWISTLQRMVALPRINGVTAPFPRGIGRRVSADGLYVVGQDANGTQLPPPANRPSLIDPGITIYNPSVTPFMNQLTEAFVADFPYGTSAGLGDLADNEQRFPDPQDDQPVYFDSRANDVSSGPLYRVVGNSYAGGINGLDDTEHYRTAMVYPSLRGTGGMGDLKVELASVMGLDIDGGNRAGFKFDLTNATAISSDGKVIVGTARCTSDQDYSMEDVFYGFVVRINR